MAYVVVLKRDGGCVRSLEGPPVGAACGRTSCSKYSDGVGDSGSCPDDTLAGFLRIALSLEGIRSRGCEGAAAVGPCASGRFTRTGSSERGGVAGDRGRCAEDVTPDNVALSLSRPGGEGLCAAVCSGDEAAPDPLDSIGDNTGKPGLAVLLLLGGIFNFATSLLSLTGGTIAVRPLAPRHSGRGAGASCGLVLVDRVRRRRSRKEVGFGGEVLLSVDDSIGSTRVVRPCTYSCGFTWDGRPFALVVGSPVLGSQRTS